MSKIHTQGRNWLARSENIQSNDTLQPPGGRLRALGKNSTGSTGVGRRPRARAGSGLREAAPSNLWSVRGEGWGVSRAVARGVQGHETHGSHVAGPLTSGRCCRVFLPGHTH